MARKLFSTTLINTATINLCQNPSFELEPNGATTFNWWQTYTTSGSPIFTVDTTYAKFGSKSFHISAAANVDAGVQSPTLALAANTTYKLSAYIKTGANVVDACLILQNQQFFNAAISVHQTSANVDWTRFSGSFTTGVSAENHKILIGFGSYGTAGPGDAWFDGIQLEAQSSVTAYCDGDQNECFWLGSPHFSQSKRVAVSRTAA